MEQFSAFFKLLFPVILSVSLIACGGGGSSGGDAGVEPPSDNPLPGAEGQDDSAITPSTGVLFDARIENLAFRTPSFSGYTTAQGEFRYAADETVVFSLGDLEFPALPGKEFITVVDLLNATEVSQEVINLARLLQSLDTNPDEDVISLPDLQVGALAGVDFGLSAMAFETSDPVVAILRDFGNQPNSQMLVPEQEAVDHLYESAASLGVVLPDIDPLLDNDGDRSLNSTDTDDDNDGIPDVDDSDPFQADDGSTGNEDGDPEVGIGDGNDNDNDDGNNDGNSDGDDNDNVNSCSERTTTAPYLSTSYDSCNVADTDLSGVWVIVSDYYVTWSSGSEREKQQRVTMTISAADENYYTVNICSTYHVVRDFSLERTENGFQYYDSEANAVFELDIVNNVLMEGVHLSDNFATVARSVVTAKKILDLTPSPEGSLDLHFELDGFVSDNQSLGVDCLIQNSGRTVYSVGYSTIEFAGELLKFYRTIDNDGTEEELNFSVFQPFDSSHEIEINLNFSQTNDEIEGEDDGNVFVNYLQNNGEGVLVEVEVIDDFIPANSATFTLDFNLGGQH